MIDIQEYERMKKKLEESKRKILTLEQEIKKHDNVVFFKTQLDIPKLPNNIGKYFCLEEEISNFIEQLDCAYYDLNNYRDNEYIDTLLKEKKEETQKNIFNILTKYITNDQTNLFCATLRCLDYSCRETLFDYNAGLLFPFICNFPSIYFCHSITKDIYDDKITNQELKNFIIEVIPVILSKFENDLEKKFNANACDYIGNHLESEYSKDYNRHEYYMNGEIYLLTYYTQSYESYFRITKNINNKDNSSSDQEDKIDENDEELWLVHFCKRNQ
jgi:hypothetical protein